MMTIKDYKRVLYLHATMISPTGNANEAAVARQKLMQLLAKHGFKEDALVAVLTKATEEVRKHEEAKAAKTAAASAPPEQPPQWSPLDDAEKYPLLDLLTAIIDQYISVTPKQCLFIALWILHTYTFEHRKFMHTPRLLITSPVRGCGKSTLIMLLNELTVNGMRSDHLTPASIYYSMRPGDNPFDSVPTFLLDEADNLDILHNHLMKSVLNAGYIDGGSIGRVFKGAYRKFDVFAPMAIAAIDALNILPMPLLRRCITIEMQRRIPSAKPLQKLKVHELSFQREKEMICTMMHRWATGCQLTSEPEIPTQLSDSSADNCRPLLAIADELGRGTQAREAALMLTDHQKEDETILMLQDIRTIFDTFKIDRVWVDSLVEALLNLPNTNWTDWRGPHGHHQPHKLTSRELRTVLRSFSIMAPQTIWEKGTRATRGSSNKGWYRSDFDLAWAVYCAGTRTHGHTEPKGLPKPKAKAKAKAKPRRRHK